MVLRVSMKDVLITSVLREVVEMMRSRAPNATRRTRLGRAGDILSPPCSSETARERERSTTHTHTARARPRDFEASNAGPLLVGQHARTRSSTSTCV